jgi:hypothetical protein
MISRPLARAVDGSMSVCPSSLSPAGSQDGESAPRGAGTMALDPTATPQDVVVQLTTIGVVSVRDGE